LVCIVAAGRPLLGALLGETRFGPENLDLAAALLMIFYSLLFLLQLEQIGRKIVITLDRTNDLYFTTSAIQLISTAIAWPLVSSFGIYGAMGSVAINAALLTVAPYVVLMRVEPKFISGYQPLLLLKWLAAAFVGVACAISLDSYLSFDLTALQRIKEAAWCITLAGTAVSVAILVALICRVPEVMLAGTALRALLRRSA
jgi:O-antigen/teichoic acid export membrane protein